MKKTKLLIANDASCLGTGYGVYGQELLSRLHDSGKYDIAEIGCYVDINNPICKTTKWKFYPNAVHPSDPRTEQYKQNIVNQFGAWRFSKALLHFQPDIVFDVRDYWMYAYQETNPFRKHFKWVLMPTVDSSPQKQEWLYTFANADLIVPYTNWAKKTLTKQCKNKINLFPKIVNAGVDLSIFKPTENKKLLQKETFGKEVSITGVVMRNQKRKLFPDLFRAYRGYLDRLISENKKELYEKSYLYLHTSYPEEHGWDLPLLLLEHSLLDKVYCNYMCKQCGVSYPEKFHQSISVCKHCHKKSLIMPGASSPVSTDVLAKTYNLFDLFIQYAICEGFGMPQVEAAACGVPIASVYYSAMEEIVDNLEGFRIPVKRLFRELETGADRAYPDIEATTDMIYNFFANHTQEQQRNMSNRTRELCEKYYSWDGVAKIWDEAFQSLDLSDNIPWDVPNPNPCQHTSQTVPQNLSPTDFVRHIVLNIINEPLLLETAPIKTLMKNFGSGIFPGKGALGSYSYKDVAAILEKYLNNKLSLEDLRQNKEKIMNEDYLNV
jgi:glycosyltransferase involved in cell wall biosynthesis